MQTFSLNTHIFQHELVDTITETKLHQGIMTEPFSKRLDFSDLLLLAISLKSK